MTQNQVNKVINLNESITHLENCINNIKTEAWHLHNDFLYKNCCQIAKEEVLSVFENKLKELKTELEAL